MNRLAIALGFAALLAVLFVILDNPRVTARQDQRPLSVNPSFAWAKTWGGSSAESAKNIAIDPWGNLYVVGEFAGTVNFDPASANPSATITSHNGTVDAFLSKFDANGNLQWVRTWGSGPVGGTGGNGRDAANGVAVDGAGNVYVSGLYQGTVEFGSGITSTSNAPMGSNNIFVAKFNSNGTTQWVRTWGGTSGGESYSVAVDKVRGNVYVEGDWSTAASNHMVDFNPIIPNNPKGAHDWHTNHGAFDSFLGKYDLDGNFQWAKTWGGHGYDDGPGVAVDGLGNVYVGGMFGSTDINFDPSGATNTGGVGHEHGTTTNDMTNVNVFLSKFNSNGAFQWVRTWGGLETEDAGEVVMVDKADNVYIGGRFQCTNCNFNAGPTGQPVLLSSIGDRDAFLSKYDASGNFLWAKTWGGTGWDAVGGLAVDQSNNVYASGLYSTTVDFGGGSVASHGLWDAFVNTFDAGGNFQGVKTWGGNGNDGCLNIAIDRTNALYAVGFFSGPGVVDLDPGTGVDNHTAIGGLDAFLIKFLFPSVPSTLYLPLITQSVAP